MTDKDEFSRRATAPSVHTVNEREALARARARDPKATIQPGSVPSSSARVYDRPASTITDLDERQAQRMIDLAAMLRGDQHERDEKINTRFEALEQTVEKFVKAAESMPPPAPAPVAGDLVTVLRPKLPSMTGDPKRDAELLRDALAQNQRADSMRYGSVSESLNETNLRIAKVESAVKAQPGAFERILKDKNVLHYVYLALVAVLGLAGQTLAQRALTKDAVKDGAREAAASAAATVQKPSVIIVHDEKENY